LSASPDWVKREEPAPQPKFEEYPLRARIAARLVFVLAVYGADNLLWKFAAALWG